MSRKPKTKPEVSKLVYRGYTLEIEEWRDTYWWIKRPNKYSVPGADFNPELDVSVQPPWWFKWRGSEYRQQKAYKYRCFDEALRTMMASIDHLLAQQQRSAEIQDRMRARIAIAQELTATLTELS